jgi:hypothetical protein
MLGLGALGQLALGQAPLTVVQADAAAHVEYTGNFLSDQTIREEMLVSDLIDCRVSLEQLSTDNRSDSSIRLEIFELLRVNWAAVFEYLDSQNIDAASRLEISELIRSDADAGVQLEIFGAVRRDIVALPEITSSVDSDVATPIEILSGIPAVNSDGALHVEIARATRADAGALPETLGAVSLNITASLEISSSSAIQASSVPLESSAVFRVDSSLRSEFVSPSFFDTASRFEWQASLFRDASLSLELTEPTVSANSSLPVELLGSATVVGDGHVNVELLSNTSQDWITWIDTLGTVTVALSDSAIQFEIIQSASYSDSALILEILQWAQLRANRNELYSEEWSGLDTIGGI